MNIVVPERFQNLPKMITVIEIAEILSYTPAYVRRLRSARIDADKRGETGPMINALPAALHVATKPLLWSTAEVITWAMWTGRIDPISGESRRLYSPGAPKRS